MKQNDKYLSFDCRYALKKILTRNLEHFRGNFLRRETRPVRLHDDNIFNNTPGDSIQEREYSDKLTGKTSIGNINRSR